MASGKITKESVDATAPGTGHAFLWDTTLKGFGLRVTPTGAKSYVFQYRMGGRESPARRYTIGGHGSPWTPKTARDECERLARMVGQGVDPAESDRERRRKAVDLAFAAYVDLFAIGYLKKRWKRWESTQAMLVRDAVPILKNKPLPDIKRSDLTAIWDRLGDRPAVARLMHATLRKMFRWAIGRGDLERSPMEGAEAPPLVTARDRVLSDAEVRLAWQATRTMGALFRGLYRLLILTGQRREEVAGLMWSEVSRADALWELPGERAKNNKPHLVPLSAMAVAVLDELAGGEQWPKKGLVFSTTGKTSISGFSKAKAQLDAKMGEIAKATIAPWRVHDLRRTFATGLQRLGVRFEVTEAVLNHISGARSGVAGVYQRHDWRDEKRAALDAWAALLNRLVA